MTKTKIGENFVTEKTMPKGFIVTDENIAKKYPELIKGSFFIIRQGEKIKNFETYKKILKKLSETNENTIIGIGGGVVGDLAGFIASTYKRGISLIQIPTTLLAVVDSSIGGKNGINFENKKNQVGTIYQPEVVLIDLKFLRTLPEKEFQNGLAEVIKYSAIFGKPKLKTLQKRISKNYPNLKKIISQSCKLKIKIVKKDEKDKGYRHTLNFGHTIGHAIEILHNLPHGQAVSIGMIKELELAIKLGYENQNKLYQVKKALIANNLPTEFPNGLNPEKVTEIMKYDKKGAFVFAFNKKNYHIKLNEEIIKDFLK